MIYCSLKINKSRFIVPSVTNSLTLLQFHAIIIVSNMSRDLTSSESDLIAGIQKDVMVASTQPEQLLPQAIVAVA